MNASPSLEERHSHTEWIESGGLSGKRLDRADAFLKGADLTGLTLEKANFAGGIWRTPGLWALILAVLFSAGQIFPERTATAGSSMVLT